MLCAIWRHWRVSSTGRRNTYSVCFGTWSDSHEAEVLYCGGARRDLGTLEERRWTDRDRPRIGSKAFQHFRPYDAHGRHQTAAPATIGALIDLGGTRRDLERRRCRPVGSFNSAGFGAFAIDDHARDRSQWRIPVLPRRSRRQARLENGSAPEAMQVGAPWSITASCCCKAQTELVA